jgi:myo-inositol-1(or 4)-monophosphatase
MVDLDARHDAAREVIEEAGALAQSYFERVGALPVRSKGMQDVVTEADVAVEELIRRRLVERFPGDAFVGEETARTAPAPGQGVWVVDPIDGTQPFISGMTGWCVSIAFVLDGALEFGFVASPAQGELFAGGRGRAATLNDVPVRLHPGRALTDGIVAVGYSPRIGPADILPVFDRLLTAGGTYFRNGSGALGLCYVACGRLLGYVEPHIDSWDCLGGVAAVLAAGGRTNDYLSGDALLSGNRLVAGPPAVFEALATVLGPSRAAGVSSKRGADPS